VKRNYSSFNDHELTQRIIQDDYKAFTEIHQRYAEKLLFYLSKLVNEQADAEDILQNVFVDLWHRRREIVLSAGLSAYLYGAARRSALFAFRTNSNRQKLIENFAHFSSDYERSPHAHLVAKELQHMVDKEIDRLAPKTKEIFVLSRREHLSHKQIAGQLGISHQTVKKQVSNALRQFRLRLNEDFLAMLFLALMWLQ
jgi:RNA polymerase sigma-70 factor, ECF subfamily